MQRTGSRARFFAIGFALYAMLVGGLFLVQSTRGESFQIALTPWRIPGTILTAIGAAILTWGILLLWLPARVGLATSLLGTFALVLVAIGHQPPKAGDVILRPYAPAVVVNSEHDQTEAYIFEDPYYGHAAQPNAVAHQMHQDYEATYSIGPDGFRKMPAPTGGDPIRIDVLGCSFTFGVGVNDDETYAAILAREAWPSFRVRNLSCSGWGTGHCYLALKKTLAEPKPPACVFYGYIDNHLQRNGQRKSWHQRTTTPFPRFAEDGEYFGLAPAATATLEDCQETYDTERKITMSIIHKMHDLCAERKIPFVILVMQSENVSLVPDLLADSTLRTIDLRNVCDEAYPHDFHPTPRTHRALADAIASEPRLSEITGIPDLFQPDAIESQPMDPKGFFLRLTRGSDARLQSLSSEECGFRAESIETETATAPSVQVCSPCPKLVHGERYRLSYRARGETARPLTLSVTRRVNPTTNLGLAASYWLTDTWQDYVHDFVANADEATASINFEIGESPKSLEVADVQMRSLSGEPAARLNVAEKCNGTLRQSADSMRVENIYVPDGTDWKVQLSCGSYAVDKGMDYDLTFRARADAKRWIRIRALQDHEPYTNLGLTQGQPLGKEWQEYRITFKARETEEDAIIAFCLGENRIAVEISEVRLAERSVDSDGQIKTLRLMAH